MLFKLVVKADPVAELDGGGIAAVLAADADVELRIYGLALESLVKLFEVALLIGQEFLSCTSRGQILFILG